MFGKLKARKTTPTTGRGSAWWVRVFLAVGRPAVVLVGLAVLAPAERHLAQVAGYGDRTSWGVAAIVSAYGGMAALTAAYVDRSHPERRTAVVGAVGAVVAGSLSQVFAHLIATGHIGVQPRPSVFLVILPSIAPVMIVGHLLHLSWVKVGDPAPTAPLSAPVTPPPAPEEAREHPAPEEAAEDEREPLVTYAEAAQLTGRAEVTVRGWVHKGTIRPVVLDGKPYLRKADLPAPIATAEQPALMEVG